MMTGARIFLLSASLVNAGCVMDHDVRVRPIADPSAKFRYGGGLLAEARAQLALGSPGIALETFRKLQREQPESADAFAGIAACYVAMGRYDLARANYEFALAYSPNNPQLLTALASSLDQLGEGAQAIQVRAEAALLAAAPFVQVQTATSPITPLAIPRLASVTVKLPVPSEPVPVKAAIEIAKPDLGAVDVKLTPARPSLLTAVDLTTTVKLAIPALLEIPPAETVAALAPGPTPADKRREEQVAEVAVRPELGPRLERMSSGEVSLITATGAVRGAPSVPQQAKPEAVSRTARAVAVLNLAEARRDALANPVRWVPLPYASALGNIQILNAARSQRLAARTRATLLDRGWRKIQIGNAQRVREHSLVLYSSTRAVAARRLAAHFHCKAVKVQGTNVVVVLLGRDAVLNNRATSRA